MKTAIITRYCYEDRLSEDRLKLFQDNFINSLAKQTTKDFDIYIICDELYGKKSHPDNLALIKLLDFKGMNVHFTNVEKHNYDIEVRLDSDDYVIDTFVEYVHSVAKKQNNILINFKPIKVVNGAQYYHERDYSDKCASMFIALIQKGIKTKGVYDRPHCEMANYMGKVLTVKEGFVFLNIHDGNMTSKMLGTEKTYPQ
jgi:hypothetical protein